MSVQLAVPSTAGSDALGTGRVGAPTGATGVPPTEWTSGAGRTGPGQAGDPRYRGRRPCPDRGPERTLAAMISTMGDPVTGLGSPVRVQADLHAQQYRGLWPVKWFLLVQLLALVIGSAFAFAFAELGAVAVGARLIQAGGR